MIAKREIRWTAELRADGGTEQMALIGYAALFNHESKDLGGFREQIAPGAFTRSLQDNADVKCTFNHDPNLVLGRSKSGTLALKQDDRGLYFRCVLDDSNTDHRNLHASVKRGDVDECSFAFTVPAGGQQWAEKKDADGEVYAARTLTEVNLMDVSAVTYPAYGGTNVVARCFPDGISPEMRSAIAKCTGVQKRDDDDSFEEMIGEVAHALATRFPAVLEDGTPVSDGPYSSGKYWLCETYAAYVIVCDWATGDYFQIPYHEDEANETFLFGEPVPVEKEWVPADSERAAKVLAELRAFADAHKKAVPAPAAPAAERAHSNEHVEGDCMDMECACQNRYVDADQVYDGDDEDIEDTNNEGTDDERAARKTVLIAERKAAFVAALRKKSDKTITKSVDSMNLPATAFAYVGDPEKTETWKLPIHDADHVRNALARFSQTQGIPAAEKAGVLAKIKAAAKKFDIKVSDEDNARCLSVCPMDEDEVRAVRVRKAMAL